VCNSKPNPKSSHQDHPLVSMEYMYQLETVIPDIQCQRRIDKKSKGNRVPEAWWIGGAVVVELETKKWWLQEADQFASTLFHKAQ